MKGHAIVKRLAVDQRCSVREKGPGVPEVETARNQPGFVPRAGNHQRSRVAATVTPAIQTGTSQREPAG